MNTTSQAIRLALILTMMSPLAAVRADQPIETQTAPPGQPTTIAPDQGATAPGPNVAALDPLLRLAPADALLVAYFDDFELLGRQLPTRRWLPEGHEAIPIIRTLNAASDGPVLLAFSGVPINPITWRITAATRTRLARPDLFALIVDELVPSVNELDGVATPYRMDFIDDGELGQVTLPGVLPLTVYLATRDSYLFASSNRALALAWQEGEDPANSFADTTTFDTLKTASKSRIGSMLWVNAKQMMPLLPMPQDRFATEFRKAAQPDLLSSVAWLLPGWEQRGPVRMVFELDSLPAGWWHAIASEPVEGSLAEVFPAGTSIFVEGGMTSAAQMVEDIYAFLATIDPVIAAEYQQERLEFAADVGLDPQSDIADNFGPQWALGWSVSNLDPEEEVRNPEPVLRAPLIAIRLKDAALFQSHLNTLSIKFGMRSTLHRYGETAIYRAERDLGPLAYAVIDDVLLIGRDVEQISQAADAAGSKTNLQTSKPFAAVRRQLPPALSKLVYLDLAQLAEFQIAMRGPAPSSLEPAVKMVTESKLATAVGIHPQADTTIVVEGAVAAMEAKASSVSPWVSLLEAMQAEMEKARQQAKRARKMSDVRGLLIGCIIYAADNKDAWPDSLEAVVEAEYVPWAMLCDPDRPDVDEADDDCAVYYLFAPPPEEFDPGTTAIITEPALRDGGLVVGFADGHVEWVDATRAAEYLAQMRSR
jgi:prepilin-type processing-associated H-X9-DG protein